jgi:hypothetical protein
VSWKTALCVLLLAPAAALPAHENGKDCEEAVTVFHDVSRIGRKDRAAANLTRRHADMAVEGWRFADSVVYTENGDLEGLFVTYIRSVPCPGNTAESEN